MSPLKTSDSDNEDSEDDASLDEDSSSSGSELSSSEPPYKTVRRQTLRESAAAYTAASSKRCLLEQVEVFTGEEEESRVMQITCKLFVFEKSTGSWLERGRGVLRLNDMATEESGNLQSRLVMRNQGNLKVILNSKLWAQMNVFKPARKKLCFTATDLENQVIRVFLIQRTRYTGQSKTTAFLSDQLKPSVIRQRKPSRIDLSIEPADTEYQNVFRSVEHAVGSLTSQDLRNTRFTVNVTKRPAFTITKMY
ncbi:Ran-binding protein 3 [Acipenser ruthenus]|uniref:Ran-binding protein 3 n=1 Tax=Acipenser ruthenus TaxID=7906 RepID=A0A444U1S6_ACIRT|nr:Ran-binding protein 3 [Acipenser ruthenus]